MPVSSGNRLLIVGAGGHARDVLWLARECGSWDVLGFLDDRLPARTRIADLEVLGRVGDWHDVAPDAALVVAIGSPRARRDVVRRLRTGDHRPRFATLVHPSVLRSPFVEVGEGSMICAGTILTTQVSIGAHAIVNMACTIAHDVRTGEFCTLGPRVALSGAVVLEEAVEVGTGAAVRQGITLRRGSMAGMGAVVVADVSENALVLGVPARAKRTLDPLRE